jgi:hypothetical protein
MAEGMCASQVSFLRHVTEGVAVEVVQNSRDQTTPENAPHSNNVTGVAKARGDRTRRRSRYTSSGTLSENTDHEGLATATYLPAQVFSGELGERYGSQRFPGRVLGSKDEARVDQLAANPLKRPLCHPWLAGRQQIAQARSGCVQIGTERVAT